MYAFDATKVEPAQDISEPLPAGEYLLEVSDTSVKENKSKNGTYVKIESTVLAPASHKGRKVWTLFNVIHENATAEKIGQEQLSALCHAANVLRFKDPQQLVGKRYVGKVTIRVSDQYGPQNEVKGWRAPKTAAPAPAPEPVSHMPAALTRQENDGLPF